MNTGNVESWAGNIADIGPIYPFVGSEFVLWIVGLVLWIGWHVIQAKRENRIYEDEKRRYGDPATLREIVSSERPDNP